MGVAGFVILAVLSVLGVVAFFATYAIWKVLGFDRRIDGGKR